MRSSLIFVAIIIADATNKHWATEYNDGGETMSFIFWMTVIFFCMDIYEVIKK